MLEEITPVRIANSIMQDTSNVGSRLLVEGKLDRLFYKKFVSSDLCEIIVAHGFYNVREAIKILNDRKFNKALGIIDLDFNFYITSSIIDNLLFTDFHDIEMMAIESNAINSIVALYCNESKMQIFETSHGNFKEALLKIIRPIGFLKLANFKDSLGLSFKSKTLNGNDLDYLKFIDHKTLTYLGDEFMINAVINYSRGKSSNLKSYEDIERSYLLVKDETIEDRLLCNGHDFCNILSLGFRRVLNNLSSTSISSDTIGENLILAFDSSEFKKSNLYKSIKAWEGKTSLPILNI